MSKPQSNRVAEQRLARGWSQNQLADAIGVHWTTISKLERGVTRLDTAYAEQIASALGVDVLDVLPKYEKWVHVALSGYLYSGGNVEPVQDNESQSFAINTTAFFDLNRFWVRVVENALYPYFKDKDLLAFEWLTDEDAPGPDGERDFSEIVGRFCLVEDAAERQFVGIVSTGATAGTLDLYNANFPPMRNIRPAAVAQVVFAVMTTPSLAREQAEKRS